MKVMISKSTPRGKITAPPSKSCAHRLLLCAALAEGESTIHGLTFSEDILATLDCICSLGGHYTIDGSTVHVFGCGGKRQDGCADFECRESGSTLRFFIPPALLCCGSSRFHGTERLIARGVSVYEELFAPQGIKLHSGASELSVDGTLLPGDFSIRGDVSSQFVSGLLFALPLLEGDSRLTVIPPVESRPYIDITIDILRKFSIDVIEPQDNVFVIRGRQIYSPAELTVEGDWSNAAFLCALNHLGGSVEVEGLDPDSLQGDRACLSLLDKLEQGFCQIDLSYCPDLAPVLFAIAAAKQGCCFTGTRRLRIKESDRAAAMAQELTKLGAVVDVGENEVTVQPGSLHKPTAELDGHNDHRIVMALSLLLAKFGGSINGAQAVNKSYPNFFEDIKKLGVEVQHEA